MEDDEELKKTINKYHKIDFIISIIPLIFFILSILFLIIGGK